MISTADINKELKIQTLCVYVIVPRSQEPFHMWDSHSFYGVIAVENVWRINQEMSWYNVRAAVAIVPAWDGESCTDGWQFTPINTLHYVSEVINRTNLDYMSFWSDVDRDFDRKHWKRSKLLPEWL